MDLSVNRTVPSRHPTLKNLLLTGLMPVGSTMYVWGGGWNKEDTGAGAEARRIGVSPVWRSFSQEQTEDYDYRQTKFQCSDGLDCSGYIGWCIYNIFNTEDNQTGYVMPAAKMAECFARWGWGRYTGPEKVKNHRAGDIMSSETHVWMAVGECSDGSVVLLHSSPPGVSLAGTAAPGKNSGEAVELASLYMKKYFPDWYVRYPQCGKDAAYLVQYGQMRWDISGAAVMEDPDEYSKMDAGKILEDLFAARGE